MTLAELKTGQKGEVIEFADYGVVAQRLEEMGLTPGETVEVVRFAPLGDPVEIKVRGYLLSLRRDEAKCVKVIER
ncbi:MAG: FeoA family protein [Candidatus Omnitrophota bacterium]|nr:FeoA family protein [Candidatus Omnitrophota bacterium]